MIITAREKLAANQTHSKSALPRCIRHAVCAGVLAMTAIGCATAPSNQGPTHRWQATHVADEVQYRNDHTRCQQQANLPADEALDSSSPAFGAYKQCMTTKGYVLTAYRN